MCGTASNDIEAKGVFVPAHRTALASTDLGRAWARRAPASAIPCIRSRCCRSFKAKCCRSWWAPIARVADEFRRMTEGRISAHSGLAVGTKQTSQIKIAKGLGGASLAEVMLADYTAMLTSGNYDWLRPLARARRNEGSLCLDGPIIVPTG